MPAAENLAPAARPDLPVTAPSSATPSFDPALPAVAALPATSPAQLVSAAAASPSSNDALPPAVLPLASVQLSLALPGAPHLPPEPELRAPGIVSGMVRDAASGVPLPDATVRLDRDGDDLVATSGADGRYSLAVSDVPDYFALSASCGGYLPDSANVSGRALRDGPVHVDFELAARNHDLVIVEELPDVHHLGNDRFDGRINSQFQKPSEGLTYVAEFELTASQARVSQLRLTLMAKGVQCPHEIRLNGAVAASLDRSPTDGSFGEFAADLEPDRLREGLNRLEIHSARCSGDIDDFEFVNVQLHLRRALPD
jgi:hypothetical protein